MAADETSESQTDFWTRPRVIVWLIAPAVLFGVAMLGTSITFDRGLTAPREAGAVFLLQRVSQAVEVYAIDQGGYPPGDGTGSASLMSCLKRPAPKNLPYFDAQPETVDAKGNLRSPMSEDRIVHYRCPGIHNPKSFDLWCDDRRGRPDGVNNWEK